MEIDYLKMFIDPILTASFRWEKSFDRFYALQKYYPLKLSKDELNLHYKIPKPVFEVLNKFIVDNKTIAVTGCMAYNMYVSVSKTEKPYIKKIDSPFFELVSIDYENDAKKIIDLLSSIDKEKVTIAEYYPFFTFTNFRTEILFDGKVVVRLFENLHNLCFSCMKYNNVTYGTFHYNLRMCLVDAMYERTNDNRDMENFYYSMASHLIQMRKYYFAGTDKTMFSDTVFKDFSVECIGFTQNEKIERDDAFKKHRRMGFKYTPGEGTTIDLSKWFFSNSSGNKIHNEKNYRIILEKDIHVPSPKIENPNETNVDEK